MMGWVYAVWYRPLDVSSPGEIITVGVDSSLRDVALQLYRNKNTHYPRLLNRIAIAAGFRGQLRYGQYRVEPGTSARALFKQMAQGTDTVMQRITIIPGWTYSRLYQQLSSSSNLRHALKRENAGALKQLLGYPYAAPEGLFFPDTYHFTWGSSDLAVLQESYDTMQRTLKRMWQHRDAGLPYKTPYQALIAASLIQTEVRLVNEMPLVSSVIVNRLKKKMRLQIDTTVLYAMGKPYGTRLLHRDLKYDSPYNTYRHVGLPPTPIAIPGRSALLAAMHPAKTSFYYYVARGDGSHFFSKNYQGHLKGVKRYREYQQQQQQQQYQAPPAVPVGQLFQQLYHRIFTTWRNWVRFITLYSSGELA